MSIEVEEYLKHALPTKTCAVCKKEFITGIEESQYSMTRNEKQYADFCSWQCKLKYEEKIKIREAQRGF